MKVGDLIRFKKTGIFGTVVEVLPLRWKADSGSVKVLAHNIKGTIPNPSVFGIENLMQVAEVISEARDLEVISP